MSRLFAFLRNLLGRRSAPPLVYTDWMEELLSEPTYLELFRGLVDWKTVDSMEYRKRAMRDPDQAHPDLLRFADELVKELAQRGVPFFIHGIFRGEKEQNRLYGLGRTKARFGSSPHNYGMAADIVHYGRYWDLSKKEWHLIGQIGYEVARRLNLKVKWGGDWSFYDPAHWELADWRDRVRLAEQNTV